MAFEVVTTDPGTTYEVDPSDFVTLPAGVILSSAGDGFDANPAAGTSSLGFVDLRIFGSVHAGARAVDFWGSLVGTTIYNDNRIFVGATGVLSAGEIGIMTESGSNNSIVNYGTIVADVGIRTWGGPRYQIQNGGTITGLNGDAIFIDGEMDTGAGLNTSITNLAGGVISGLGLSGDGITLANLVGGSVVKNFGIITSAQEFGVNLSEVNPGQSPVNVFNWGTISGGDGAYEGSYNPDTLANRGLLIGDVVTRDENDFVDNRGGTIEGNVDLGTGNDLFDNFGGTVTGTVFGNHGMDTFRLGAGAEVIDGGFNNDAIDFRGSPAVRVSLDGSVAGTGNAAGDTYFGVEYIYGSFFDDVIVGSPGFNYLFGSAGADVIDGRDGSDILRGGNGADTLTGGFGNDTFRFLSLAEISDTITDFANAAGNNDRFQIGAAGFGGGLVAGLLNADYFIQRVDNVAQDADDRFVFRTTDGTLWFDSDGSGAHDAVMVADLQAAAVVTAVDLLII